MNQTDAKANTNGAVVSDATPAPSASSNGSDLDALLNEYEKGATANANAALPKVIRAMDQKYAPVMDFVAQEAQEKANKRIADDIAAAKTVLKTGLPETVPDDFAEGELRTAYDKDPTFREAWDKRHEAPDTLNSALNKVRENFHSKVSKLVPTEQPKAPTNDISRAEAAVRNVSTEPPAKPTVDPVKLVHEMNEREYAAWKREYYRAQQAAQP